MLIKLIDIKCNFSKEGCHAELVEAWWVGLCARPFDKLRVTGPSL
jgi:hypothetical protein